MRGWVYLVTAGVLEVIWAFGLKNSETLLQWLMTLFCILGSFGFLVMATKRMEASMAYVAFVIFGTIGAYALDVSFFDKQISLLAIMAMAVMLACVVSLKRG